MCGIAGSINFDLNNHKQDLIDSLKHRGPDNQTLEKVAENIWFFHARLAIQGLSEDSNQPFHSDSSSIVFNGEIYNHLELKKKYNLNTRTSSDTETLILLLEQIGMSILDEVDGMFVFAWFNKESKKVYLARDRAGKKPLYYSLFGDNSFVFASELNALSKIAPVKISEERISKFLYSGFFYENETPYSNVQELKLGSYIELDSSAKLTIKLHSWWDILKYHDQKKVTDIDEALELADDALIQSVKNRLDSSDLEVGAFLSGGIDSGLITAVAATMVDKLKTFTVRLPGAYDESHLASLVAQKTGTDHQLLEVHMGDLKFDIDKILDNYGEPFADSSAIPSFYVSKAAKEHVTVILNGDGADELFSGYRRYVPFKKLGGLLNSSALQLTARGLSKVLPVTHEKKSYYNYLYRLVDLMSKDGYERYISATNDIFTGFESHFTKPLNVESETEVWNSLNKELNSFQALMVMDFKSILFGDLLVKMDIATMAHSLEGRSPFLSKYFLELAPTIGDSLKINGTTTKFLLRKLAEKYLPTELLNQPKRGFEIPLKKWVKDDLNEIIFDRLTSPNALVRDYLDPKFYNQVLEKNLMISDERWAKMIYTLFVTETWLLKHK